VSQLTDRIQADLAEAMRARDAVARDALRMLTAAITNARIETGGALSDDAALGVVQKQVKQRRESILEFEKAGRADLVAKESAEMVILERYLPVQAGMDEIEDAARKVIEETGASSSRDIGKVMPVLVRQFAGRADGRAINDIVRKLLEA